MIKKWERKRETDRQRKHKNRSIENRGTCLTDKFLEREGERKRERERTSKSTCLAQKKAQTYIRGRERKWVRKIEKEG